MPKKNSPGCNCCGGPSTCLQEDSREFTGIDISGVPQHVYTVGSAVFTFPDFNGSYLWSAADTRTPTPYCWETFPDDYRLGTVQPGGDCCSISWTRIVDDSTVNIGMTMPYVEASSGIRYVPDFKAKARHTFNIDLTFATTSVTYAITVSTLVNIYLDISSAIIPFLGGLGSVGYLDNNAPGYYSYPNFTFAQSNNQGNALGVRTFTRQVGGLVSNTSGLVTDPNNFTRSNENFSSTMNITKLTQTNAFDSRQTITRSLTTTSGTIQTDLI